MQTGRRLGYYQRVATQSSLDRSRIWRCGGKPVLFRPVEGSYHTNSDSRIERGDEEEATEAYILVRRGDDDEVNEVKSMKANWYHILYKVVAK